MMFHRRYLSLKVDFIRAVMSPSHNSFLTVPERFFGGGSRLPTRIRPQRVTAFFDAFNLGFLVS